MAGNARGGGCVGIFVLFAVVGGIAAAVGAGAGNGESEAERRRGEDAYLREERAATRAIEGRARDSKASARLSAALKSVAKADGLGSPLTVKSARIRGGVVEVATDYPLSSYFTEIAQVRCEQAWFNAAKIRGEVSAVFVTGRGGQQIASTVGSGGTCEAREP